MKKESMRRKRESMSRILTTMTQSLVIVPSQGTFMMEVFVL